MASPDHYARFQNEWLASQEQIERGQEHAAVKQNGLAEACFRQAYIACHVLLEGLFTEVLTQHAPSPKKKELFGQGRSPDLYALCDPMQELPPNLCLRSQHAQHITASRQLRNNLVHKGGSVDFDRVRAMHELVREVLHKYIADESDFKSDNQELYADYLASVEERAQRLGLGGVSSSRLSGVVRTLRDIYVPRVALAESVAFTKTSGEEDSVDVTLGQPVPGNGMRDAMGAASRKVSPNSGIAFPVNLDAQSKVVIRGEAGSGKSCQLHELALRECDRARQHLAAGELPGIPLLIRASDLAESLGASPVLAMDQALLELVPRRFRGITTEALDAGRVVLFVDGLDEVVAVDLRTRLRRKMEDFIAHHSNVRIIITTRAAHYKDDFAELGFKHCDLRPFDLAEAQQLFLKHMRNEADPAGLRAANELWEDLRARKELEPLLGSPLNVVGLALTARQSGQVPRNKAQLLDGLLDTLLNTWPAYSRGANVTDARFRRALEDLAFEVVESAEVGGFRVERAQDRIARAMRRHGAASDNLASAASQAYQFLCEAGVLRELEGENALATRCAFCHVSVCEYLAACALDRMLANKQVELSAYAHEPGWRDIILYMAWRVSARGTTAMRALYNQVRDLGSNYEDVLQRDYFLAYTLLAEGMLDDEGEMRSAFERIWADNEDANNFVNLSDSNMRESLLGRLARRLPQSWIAERCQIAVNDGAGIEMQKLALRLINDPSNREDYDKLVQLARMPRIPITPLCREALVASNAKGRGALIGYAKENKVESVSGGAAACEWRVHGSARDAEDDLPGEAQILKARVVVTDATVGKFPVVCMSCTWWPDKLETCSDAELARACLESEGDAGEFVARAIIGPARAAGVAAAVLEALAERTDLASSGAAFNIVAALLEKASDASQWLTPDRAEILWVWRSAWCAILCPPKLRRVLSGMANRDPLGPAADLLGRAGLVFSIERDEWCAVNPIFRIALWTAVQAPRGPEGLEWASVSALSMEEREATFMAHLDEAASLFRQQSAAIMLATSAPELDVEQCIQLRRVLLESYPGTRPGDHVDILVALFKLLQRECIPDQLRAAWINALLAESDAPFFNAGALTVHDAQACMAAFCMQAQIGFAVSVWIGLKCPVDDKWARFIRRVTDSLRNDLNDDEWHSMADQLSEHWYMLPLHLLDDMTARVASEGVGFLHRMSYWPREVVCDRMHMLDGSSNANAALLRKFWAWTCYAEPRHPWAMD